MLNGTMLQYFHWYCADDCNLWNKLSEDTEYLKSVGINAVWLPPAYKGIEGTRSIGYDTYDLFDLGEFDQKGSVKTKYGSKDEYIAAVKKARENGIAVYVDIVLNHKAGADEKEKFMAMRVDPDNRMEAQGEPKEIVAYTKFTFPGRGKTYSDFEWNFRCFGGVDYAENLDPQNGVFRIIHEYGDNWEDVISHEHGNYDYLMHADIEFRNPYVREELKRWINWYYDTVPFDGLRLDAVKHISAEFFNEWLDHIKTTIPQEMFVVGECWSTTEPEILHEYIEKTGGRIKLFDSILQNRFHQASTAGNNFDMSSIFNGTLVQENPSFAVTLVDNHDTQPLQSLEAPVEFWFRPIAYSLILLREQGYPCVFHPDIFGATYKDRGGDGNEYEIKIAKTKNIDKLLQARQLFAHGPQADYFDHNNCIAWIRYGAEDTPGSGCVVICTNGDAGFKDMNLGDGFANCAFYDYLGNHEGEMHVNEHGEGRFEVAPGSVSVWVRKS